MAKKTIKYQNKNYPLLSCIHDAIRKKKYVKGKVIQKKKPQQIDGAFNSNRQINEHSQAHQFPV